MANNRLYIVDTETNEKILFCKSSGQWEMRIVNSDGGYAKNAEESIQILNNWLKDRDIGSTTGDAFTKLVLRTEDEI